MFWLRAAFVILPAMTYSCSSPGNFQCNTNVNGHLFESKAVNADMSISYHSANRVPCGLDMKIIAGDDVMRGKKPLVITKTDLKVLPQHGTFNRNGSYITYTPANSYVGSDGFTVVVTGSAGDLTGVSTLNFSIDVKQ